MAAHPLHGCHDRGAEHHAQCRRGTPYRQQRTGAAERQFGVFYCHFRQHRRHRYRTRQTRLGQYRAGLRWCGPTLAAARRRPRIAVAVDVGGSGSLHCLGYRHRLFQALPTQHGTAHVQRAAVGVGRPHAHPDEPHGRRRAAGSLVHQHRGGAHLFDAVQLLHWLYGIHLSDAARLASEARHLRLREPTGRDAGGLVAAG